MCVCVCFSRFRSKLPSDTTQINFTASTAENYQGTTKATYHPPGYSGFIPETGRNAHATAQSPTSRSFSDAKPFASSVQRFCSPDSPPMRSVACVIFFMSLRGASRVVRTASKSTTRPRLMEASRVDGV